MENHSGEKKSSMFETVPRSLCRCKQYATMQNHFFEQKHFMAKSINIYWQKELMFNEVFPLKSNEKNENTNKNAKVFLRQ